MESVWEREDCTIELCSEPCSGAVSFRSSGAAAFLPAAVAGVVVATLGKAL